MYYDEDPTKKRRPFVKVASVVVLVALVVLVVGFIIELLEVWDLFQQLMTMEHPT
jgi:hypothetical protein